MYLIILFEPEINSYFVIFFVHIEYHCNSHIPQPSNNKDIGIMIPNTLGTDVIFEHISPASPEISGSSLCTLFPSHREPTTLQEHRRLVFLETSCNLHRLEDLFGQECWLSFCLQTNNGRYHHDIRLNNSCCCCVVSINIKCKFCAQ